MKKSIISKEQMWSEAEKFVNDLKKNTFQTNVFGLSGDLGAGKTTFVQGLAKVLGIDSRVISPTFVIEKRYEIKDFPFKYLIHIDAYRLSHAKETESLHFQKTCEDRQNLVLVEWPEKIADAMPKNWKKITFEHSENGNENERHIVIE